MKAWRDFRGTGTGRRSRRAWLALGFFAISLVLGLTQCSKSGPGERAIPVTRLSGDFEPLRAQFNKDSGKVRLMLLLDPT